MDKLHREDRDVRVQNCFGDTLWLAGGQLLTADPYTNFHRANEMRTAAQRALFKQNSARAVQAAGLARHRSQPREDINAGDTTMVWRNNKLTGRKGWTGPGVVVAVSPTRTSVLDLHAWMPAEVLE